MPRPFAKKKTLIDHATELAESALETIESAFEQAKEAAGPATEEARERAIPLIQDARDRAVPLLHDARETAAEKASTGAAAAKAAAAAAAAAAAEQAAQGREFAATKLAEVKGEPVEEQKGGKLKKLFFFGALAAIGGLLYRKLRTNTAEEDNWQSSYVPPPPAPAPTPSPADGLADPLTDPLPGQEEGMATDDPGGAGPDEALADATDAPHEATTPDNPAEVVDIDEVDGEKSKK
jgi:hypothetical protein